MAKTKEKKQSRAEKAAREKKTKGKAGRFFLTVLILGLLGACILLGINTWVKAQASQKILSEQEAA